jgi:hypothetical protein
MTSTSQALVALAAGRVPHARGRPARAARVGSAVRLDGDPTVAASADAPATPSSAVLDDVTGMRLVSIEYPSAHASAANAMTAGSSGEPTMIEMQALRDDERDFGETIMKPVVRTVRPRRLSATTVVTMDAPLPAARAIASSLAATSTTPSREAAEEEEGDIEDVLAAPPRHRSSTHRLPLAQQVAKADQEAEAHERQELSRQQQRCALTRPTSDVSIEC